MIDYDFLEEEGPYHYFLWYSEIYFLKKTEGDQNANIKN